VANREWISNNLRMIIYERDEYTCQHCGRIGEFIWRFGKPCVVDNPDNIIFKRSYYNGSDVIPFEIDHVKPVVEGGDNSIDNLQLLCRFCNRSKGSSYGQ